MTAPSTAAARAPWLTPGLLLTLTSVPTAAGVARLTWLATGEIRPDSLRFASNPTPLVLHILAVTLFGVLGAFQFTPGLRRSGSGWHRTAGRVLIPAGLTAAVTGLWMTQFYPPGAHDGPLLHGLRLVFGLGMALSILIGVNALHRREFASHGAWMLRGYAIGMGAGTQVLVFLPWTLLAGAADELSRGLLMGAGWVLNLLFAEWVIRRRPAPPLTRPVL